MPRNDQNNCGYLLEHNIIKQEFQVKVFDLDFVWKISIWAIFALYYATTWPKLKLIKFKLSKESNEKIT